MFCGLLNFIASPWSLEGKLGRSRPSSGCCPRADQPKAGWVLSQRKKLNLPWHRKVPSGVGEEAFSSRNQQGGLPDPERSCEGQGHRLTLLHRRAWDQRHIAQSLQGSFHHINISLSRDNHVRTKTGPGDGGSSARRAQMAQTALSPSPTTKHQHPTNQGRICFDMPCTLCLLPHEEPCMAACMVAPGGFSASDAGCLCPIIAEFISLHQCDTQER